jgi:hypothetical protein
MSDTPTTNYCTLNPLDSVAGNLINGNLEYYDTSGNGEYAASTMSFDIVNEKYYIEYEVGTLNYNRDRIGIIPETNTGIYSGTYANSHAYYAANGNKQPANTAFGASINVGDILGVAVGNGQIEYFKNGVSQGVLASGLTGRYKFASSGAENAHGVYNFGQRAFAYTPPTGYKALNTANLPEPDIKDGGAHFNTVLYTGDNLEQVITGVNFQPDWVWVKCRNQGSTNHVLQDAVRGAQKYLTSDTTVIEGTSNGTIISFDSDGFTIGAGNPAVPVNNNGDTFVAWNWKANGSGREAAQNWAVYHGSLGATKAVYLDTSAKNDTNSGYWNNTAPTSTVFSIGTNTRTGGSTNDYVAYCFSEVEGYSKFGGYKGNGNADGPFVYCGFRPAFVLIKNYAGGSETNWIMRDSARSPYNKVLPSIYANTNAAEINNFDMDFLSNGFKIKDNNAVFNENGSDYLFIAFAENPFGGSGPGCCFGLPRSSPHHQRHPRG